MTSATPAPTLEEQLAQMTAKLEAAEIEHVRSSTWAFDLYLHCLRLQSAVRNFASDAKPGPPAAAQRIIGYRDRYEEMLTTTAGVLPALPTADAVRAARAALAAPPPTP